MKIEVHGSRAVIEDDTGVVGEDGAITWTERCCAHSNPLAFSQAEDGLSTSASISVAVL
eukprot:COSAG02_NODE_1856_length_10648_cov_8.834581_12_plen_59_part_00